MHGRVEVAEVPLVGRDRAVRVLVPLAQQQVELPLGEPRIDVREGHGVEGQVPRGEPRVLPRVGHGDHIAGVEVPPGPVPDRRASLRRGGLAGVAVLPAPDAVGEELLAPDHPRERLAQDTGLVRGACRRCDGVVEGVGLRLPARHDLLRIDRGRDGLVIGEPLLEAQHELHGLPGGDVDPVPPRRLGPLALGVDGRRAGDDVVVDPVLGVARDRVRTPDARLVGRVVAEEGFRGRPPGRTLGVQPVPTEARVLGDDAPVTQAQARSTLDLAAGPGVAEPQGRQDMDRPALGAVVRDSHPHDDVLRTSLRVLDLHGEEPVVVEHPGVQQLVLPHVLARARFSSRRRW